MAKIVVAPGHGGDSTGAVGPSGTKEKYFTLRIGELLRQYLERYGHIVYLTRDRDDIFMSLEDQVQFTKDTGSDLFISPHINGSHDRDAHGAEVWVPNRESRSPSVLWAEDMTLGYLVLRHLSVATNLAVRKPGVKYMEEEAEEFYVLRNSEVPAILTETGFITNPSEEEYLKNEWFLEKIALGITYGVVEYLSIPKYEGRI